MKHKFLVLLLAASAAAASAQTAAKQPSTNAAKPATATRSTAAGVKVPPGVPPVKGVVKTAFSLRYQDIKTGTGAEAEFLKSVTVHYTGWVAADGRKFDSSYDRRTAVLDKDNMPVMDTDGKPKLGDPHPEPFNFIEGNPRLIPGWNLGVDGMKVGGKRRLLIPWQLAYGAKGRPGPDAAHPGIPAKADLIFDVELLDVTEMPMPQNHLGMSGMTGGRPMPGGIPPHPGITIPANHPPVPSTAPAAPPATPTQPVAPAASSAPTSAPAPAAPATPAQPK